MRPNLYVSLKTYGQPRVGNANFAKFVNQMTDRTERVVHYADIVPHLPAQSYGFQHYNMEYWYEPLMYTYTLCIA